MEPRGVRLVRAVAGSRSPADRVDLVVELNVLGLELSAAAELQATLHLVEPRLYLPSLVR